jgi:uncharacterized protein (TIGR03435 family)
MVHRFSKTFRRYSVAFLCLMVGLTVLGVQARAQGSNGAHGSKLGSESAKKKDVKFEVISIRPVVPGSAVGAGYTPNPTPDGFVSSLTVWQMLMIAYAPNDQSWGSIPIISHTPDAVSWGGNSATKSAPKWLGDWYVINARVSDADRDAWRDQSSQHDLLRAAMRDLLKERCHLVVHEQPTDLPDYNLVIGKKGLKGLKATVPGSTPPKDAYRLPTGGFRFATGDRSRPTWHYYGATIGELIDFLRPPGNGSPAPPVRDQTGLTGRYDFAITMIDEPSRDPVEEIYNFPLGPLGLALKPGKYHAFSLIIEHMDKPSPNE